MPTDPLPQAQPRAAEDIRKLPDCPKILARAELLGIKQVVHFTTKRGVVGVLASGEVMSRNLLSKEYHLEHIYSPNVPRRFDEAWVNYVNLSIERINNKMYEFSNRKHLKDGSYWAVLSFKPMILAHPGVVFTTTNNIYPACQRGEGLAGLSRMYADIVLGRHQTVQKRKVKMPSSWPTDRQAEVLYPGALSIKYLQSISVQDEDVADAIHGMFGVFGVNFKVHYSPEMFK